MAENRKLHLDPDKLLAARKEADEIQEMLTAHKIKITTIVKDTRRGPVIECRRYRDGDVVGSFKSHDCYIDEFDTEEEAQAFIEESKHA